jgi:hypothetical protein
VINEGFWESLRVGELPNCRYKFRKREDPKNVLEFFPKGTLDDATYKRRFDNMGKLYPTYNPEIHKPVLQKVPAAATDDPTRSLLVDV